MDVQTRVKSYRDRMRARGYRPIQIWVPDVRSDSFCAEAQRQAALVARFSADSEDQDFIEAVSVDWGDA